MASNSSLNLVNLDFDLMKGSLATFLKSQDQFKDYNFDGSAMNVLLDVLSYNTFKNAFYLNMIHSEGFLDSAQLQDSVYSHAKELNYLPRSAKSSVANVTISFTANNAGQPYFILKGLLQLCSRISDSLMSAVKQAWCTSTVNSATRSAKVPFWQQVRM